MIFSTMAFRLNATLIVSVFCVATTSIFSAQAIAEELRQPNVVLIMADDAGWADFGFHGSKVIPTPNLDQLARSGVRFTNAYTVSNCGPSRACLATGIYNTRIGFEHNFLFTPGAIGETKTMGLRPDQPTVFDHMRKLGYSTCVVGKWHLGFHPDQVKDGELIQPGNLPPQQGVDEFRGILGGERSYWGGEHVNEDPMIRHQCLGRNGIVIDNVLEKELEGKYVTDVFAEWSVDYIRRHYHKRRPFFLFTSFTAPHNPLEAKPEDLAAIDAMGNGLEGDRKIYAAMSLAMDRGIGKILQALDDPNGDNNNADSIRANTLVIFTNDNGGNSHINSNRASNEPFRGGKASIFEGGVRVPIVLNGPGIDESFGDGQFHHPVHMVDLMPTILATGGATELPTGIDGVNLLPHVNGEKTQPPHQHIYLRRLKNSAIRMDKWKLVHLKDESFKLFDLQSSPSENIKHNVANHHPDVVAEMKKILRSYDVQMRRPLWGDTGTDTNTATEYRLLEPDESRVRWSQKNAWIGVDRQTSPLTMTSWDSDANIGLTFCAGKANHVCENDLKYPSGLTLIANRIRFDSVEQIDSSTSLTIIGHPILLTQDLSGRTARIQLDSVSPAEHEIVFAVDIVVQLYSDLDITGDGNDVYLFERGLREQHKGINVRKFGSSELTLDSKNKISGRIEIHGGTLKILHPQALGKATVVVHKNGTLKCEVPLSEGAKRRISGDGTIEL